MREGNLKSRTTPQGSPPEAVRHSPSCSTGVLSDALWRILDFKLPLALRSAKQTITLRTRPALGWQTGNKCIFKMIARDGEICKCHRNTRPIGQAPGWAANASMLTVGGRIKWPLGVFWVAARRTRRLLPVLQLPLGGPDMPSTGGISRNCAKKYVSP
jgi:hypothetical protein